MILRRRTRRVLSNRQVLPDWMCVATTMSADPNCCEKGLVSERLRGHPFGERLHPDRQVLPEVGLTSCGISSDFEAPRTAKFVD